MKKNQKGFSPIWIAIVFLVLTVAGFAGWRAWSSRNEPIVTQLSVPEQQKEFEDEKPEIEWLTYKNKEAGLTFNYPSDWKHEVGEVFRFDGKFSNVQGTVTSPSGKKLTWALGYAGGSGGFCEPDEGDTPFSPNNKCASKQILEIEQLPPIEKPTGEWPWDIFEDYIYITKTKYMDTEGGISYHLCLDALKATDTPKIGTSMGLYFPCSFWRTGFNARFDVRDQADFRSEDAKLAEQIMKSFNSL